MGLMDKYNKGDVVFDIDIKNFKFKTLEELYNAGDTVKWIDGIYINKRSNFGDHPVAIIIKDEMLVDLPAHLTEDVKAILQDNEVIEGIKAGKVGIQIEQYEQKKYKKTCYGIKWVEAL